MKLSIHLVLVPLMFAGATVADAACVYPQAPQSFPNGAQATKEEMLAAQGPVKEYSKTVQEVYLPCLEAEKNESIAALDPADPELAQKKTAIEAVHAKKHNAALDELTAVANRWSDEMKAYQAQAKK